MSLDTLREETHRRRSRLESLEEIQSRYERFQTGVRAIMQKVQGPSHEAGVESSKPEPGAVKGLVADVLRAP